MRVLGQEPGSPLCVRVSGAGPIAYDGEPTGTNCYQEELPRPPECVCVGLWAKVRDRVNGLLDPGTAFLELSVLGGHEL
jgi:hypothetical protein